MVLSDSQLTEINIQHTIIVNRQVEAVPYSSWNFQTATWAKESGFGTSTVTINGQSCTYASGALEGLALQDWFRNGLES